MINYDDFVIVGDGAVSKALQKKCSPKIIRRMHGVDDLRFKGKINLIIAAPSAKKHLANADPAQDAEECYRLIEKVNKLLQLNKINSFIAISTIDVFGSYHIVRGNEESFFPLKHLSVYGANRAWLERIFLELGASIIRLPTVYGNSLKKGIIFDIINKNTQFLPRKTSSLQFFCLENLFDLILMQIKSKIKVLNIAPPAITLRELCDCDDLNSILSQKDTGFQVDYRMETIYKKNLVTVNKRAFEKKALKSDLRGYILSRRK